MSEDSRHITVAMIEQFLQAGLPESELADLLKHLRTCPECRCRVDSYRFWSEFESPRNRDC